MRAKFLQVQNYIFYRNFKVVKKNEWNFDRYRSTESSTTDDFVDVKILLVNLFIISGRSRLELLWPYNRKLVSLCTFRVGQSLVWPFLYTETVSVLCNFTRFIYDKLSSGEDTIGSLSP